MTTIKFTDALKTIMQSVYHAHLQRAEWVPTRGYRVTQAQVAKLADAGVIQPVGDDFLSRIKYALTPEGVALCKEWFPEMEGIYSGRYALTEQIAPGMPDVIIEITDNRIYGKRYKATFKNRIEVYARGFAEDMEYRLSFNDYMPSMDVEQAQALIRDLQNAIVLVQRFTELQKTLDDQR